LLQEAKIYKATKLKVKIQDTAIRAFIYILGIFILAMGGALSINASLGVSPMNALPFVLSLITGRDLGGIFSSMLALFIVIQIIILKKEFKWIQIGQLIGAVLFGKFLDFSRFLIGDFFIPTYFGQLFLLVMGILCISTGIRLFISTGFVLLPLESLIKVIIEKVPKYQYHQIMIVVSVLLVTLSVIFSLIFLGGVYGVREGTVISAVLVGRLMPLIDKMIFPVLNKLYKE